MLFSINNLIKGEMSLCFTFINNFSIKKDRLSVTEKELSKMNWNITIRKNYLFGFCFLLLLFSFTWNTNSEQKMPGFSIRVFKHLNGLVQQQLAAIDPIFTKYLELGENRKEEIFGKPEIEPGATCSGNANVVSINTGVVSATNALNGADDTGASLNDSGDQLGLDLNDILQSGATYTIRWRRNTGTSSNPSFTVEESTDGATWVAADGSPFTITSTAWADNNFTANTDTRYVRITTTDVYDLDVDAITYTSVECLDLETSSTESTTALSFVGVECGNTTTNTITVPDNITITDINIGLNVSLDYRHHLTATVTSPNGTTVELTSNGAYSGGSTTIHNWDVLFDDASSNSLNDGDSDDVGAPYYESERIANPSGTLSAFNGENSSGVWTLAVCDAVTSTINGGTVNRWKIDITGIIPCSATADAPVTTTGTCNGGIANDDGIATVNNITNADKIGISSALASSYDGPDYASAIAISGSSHIFSNLEQGKNYIIRVYESGGGACHTDIAFTTAAPPAACSGLPSGLPWPGSQCAGKEIIFQNGVGILTCGVTASTSNADRYTVALMNFTGTVPTSGRTETTSSVDVYHHPSWHVDSIGNVFGTTINTRTGEMLVTASSNYGGGFLGNNAVIRYGAIAGGTADGTNDAVAGGAVYKINASTGQASVFALLPQQATSFVNDDCESSDAVTRTNSGVGLGNIVYDEGNNQYFVSNIEDGRIYRLGSDGTILDSYDPFGNDNGSAGISDLEELVYGLAIEPGTSNLFFGGVDDAPDATDYASAGSPSVYSITLTSSGGFPGAVNNTTLPAGATYSNYENATETLHITVPTGEGSSFADNYVYLISDLAFNQNNQLVIAVRVGCENSFFTSYNHWAETSIVNKNSSTGQYSDNLFEFDITHTGSAGVDDSYGGVATYVDNSGNNFIAGSAADILQESGPHGIAVFNDPPAAGQIDPLAAVSYGVAGSDPKGVGGDIDIFTECTACELTLTTNNQSICNDNGTPSIGGDDYFSLTFNATAVNGSTQYEVVTGANADGTGGTILGTSDYGVAITVGDGTNGVTGTFLADGATTYNITIRDASDNTCHQDFTTTILANCAIPCAEINQLIADRTICSGDAIDSLAATTTFTNPDSIAFVYFTTQQTDSSVIYTGGTGIDTLQISSTTDSIILTNHSIPAFVSNGNEPDTFYVYAIKHPLPSGNTCRPYEEILVIVNPIPSIITRDTFLCLGSSLELDNMISNDGGITADTSWFTNYVDALANMNPMANSVITPTTDSTYYVRLINTANTACFVLDSVTINQITEIAVSINSTCNNNNTFNNDGDDYFTIEMTVTTATPGISTQFNVYNGADLIGTGTYGIPLTLTFQDSGNTQRFLANGTDSYNLRIEDNTVLTCEKATIVTAVDHCSFCPTGNCLDITIQKN